MIHKLLIYFLLLLYAADLSGKEIDTSFTNSISIEEEINIESVLLLPIYIYQNFLGRIKGSYCPMYPSCSNYGSESIRKHGLKGLLMTFDRLHRCGHDYHNYQTIIIHDQIYYFDSVE
jgi:putative component of membrane protein insertase Oxa1/YidC/SpoIIIJ protein YidD|tara:strand:+ start:259 stop:612 length:354 start_codon:yes stop_codon:yes gene_type:complete